MTHLCRINCISSVIPYDVASHHDNRSILVPERNPSKRQYSGLPSRRFQKGGENVRAFNIQCPLSIIAQTYESLVGSLPPLLLLSQTPYESYTHKSIPQLAEGPIHRCFSTHLHVCTCMCPLSTNYSDNGKKIVDRTLHSRADSSRCWGLLPLTRYSGS